MNSSEDQPTTIEAINDFWIGEAAIDPVAARSRTKLWYQSTPADDEALRARFGSAHQRAAAGELDDWQDSASGSLALVILLDQFSRNLYRGTADAFASDAHAREVTRAAIANGQHLTLSYIGRIFLYHPFHHSEEIADQDACVALYEALLAAAEPAWHEQLQGFLDYALEHREVVRQFGRFPHRNAVLGRDSTPGEIAYLAAGARRYGQ
ncbi:MAG: DUF924 family protein [Pseudomonadota bacterium]